MPSRLLRALRRCWPIRPSFVKLGIRIHASHAGRTAEQQMSFAWLRPTGPSGVDICLRLQEGSKMPDALPKLILSRLLRAGPGAAEAGIAKRFACPCNARDRPMRVAHPQTMVENIRKPCRPAACDQQRRCARRYTQVVPATIG